MRSITILFISLFSLTLAENKYGPNIMVGDYDVSYDEDKAKACCVPSKHKGAIGYKEYDHLKKFEKYMQLGYFNGSYCETLNLDDEYDIYKIRDLAIVFEDKENASWENFDKSGTGIVKEYSKYKNKTTNKEYSYKVNIHKTPDSFKVDQLFPNDTQIVSWTANFKYTVSTEGEDDDGCNIDMTFTKKERLVCPAGQYNNKKTCTTCPDKCTSCVSDKICTNCEKGYGTSYNGNRLCHICEDGEYLDQRLDGDWPFSNCNKCTHGCAKCTSSRKCSACKDSFVMKTDKNGDTECGCLDNQYYNGTKCTECTENCKTCSGFICKECKDGFKKNILGWCEVDNIPKRKPGDTKPGEDDKPKEGGGSGWGTFFIVLLVLLVIGGAGYLAYRKGMFTKIIQKFNGNNQAPLLH